MGQRVTLHLLGDRSLFVAACACGEKGEGIEGIEGREVCRQLFVLVRQLEPNIEGAPKPLLVEAFNFPVELVRPLKQVVQLSGGLPGPAGSRLRGWPVSGSRTGSGSGTKSVRTSSGVARIK